MYRIFTEDKQGMNARTLGRAKSAAGVERVLDRDHRRGMSTDINTQGVNIEDEATGERFHLMMCWHPVGPNSPADAARLVPADLIHATVSVAASGGTANRILGFVLCAPPALFPFSRKSLTTCAASDNPAVRVWGFERADKAGLLKPRDPKPANKPQPKRR